MVRLTFASGANRMLTPSAMLLLILASPEKVADASEDAASMALLTSIPPSRLCPRTTFFALTSETDPLPMAIFPLTEDASAALKSNPLRLRVPASKAPDLTMMVFPTPMRLTSPTELSPYISTMLPMVDSFPAM